MADVPDDPMQDEPTDDHFRALFMRNELARTMNTEDEPRDSHIAWLRGYGGRGMTDHQTWLARRPGRSR